MVPRDRCGDVVAWRRTVLASDLRSAAKVVLLCLLEHMDWHGEDAGGSCWPAIDTIAERAGMSRSAAIRALGNADEGGYIERVRGGGRHVVTRYHATLPAALNSGVADTVSRYRQAQETVSVLQETVSVLAGNSGGDATRPISTSQDLSLSAPASVLADHGATDDEAREILAALETNPRIAAPVAYLRTLADNGDLAAHVARYRATRPRPSPPWCGGCDEATRHVDAGDGREAPCPDCHPQGVSADAS
jgi:hypothetical protein